MPKFDPVRDLVSQLTAFEQSLSPELAKTFSRLVNTIKNCPMSDHADDDLIAWIERKRA